MQFALKNEYVGHSLIINIKTSTMLWMMGNKTFDKSIKDSQE